MLSREEIKKWLLENCIDSSGNLHLSDLDFSDFDGDVLISFLKVKHSLYQRGQEVGGYLYQADQSVKQSLYQHNQKVGGNLHQTMQKVAGSLYQTNQKVVGNIFQDELKRPSKSQAEIDELQTVEIDKLKTEVNQLIKENQELKEKLEGYETLLLHIAKGLKEEK